MSGFSADFERLREVYPKSGWTMQAWEAWCKMESSLPPVEHLINAVTAELELKGRDKFPGLEWWLLGKRWLDAPSVDECKRAKPYTDACGNSTPNPMQAHLCSCGAVIVCDHGSRFSEPPHRQRHCPACKLSYPCYGENCAKKKEAAALALEWRG